MITLNIGQAGVQIANSCWELFCQEHGISPSGQMKSQETNQQSKPNKIFSETQSGKYVPRTLYVDSEPIVVDEVRSGKYRSLFSKDQLYSNKEDASDLFSRGYYGVGKQMIDEVQDRIRKEVQKCQLFEGFTLLHSIGGGTGSGFLSRLAQRLSVEYNKKAKIAYTVFPSTQMTNSVVEAYNAILASHQMLESIDANILMQNQYIYRVLSQKLNVEDPNFTNVNRLIAQLVSSHTASMRFNSTMKMNLQQFLVNMIPYSRMQFLQPTYAPLLPQQRTYFETHSVQRITNDLIQSESLLVGSKPSHGKYLSCCFIYQGDITHRQASYAIDSVRQKMNFISFIPSGVKVCISRRPPSYLKEGDLSKTMRGGYMISNNTAMAEVFSRTDHKFDLMYARRAFVHWYNAMEEGQFHEAREDIAALQKDYDYGGSYRLEYYGCGQQQE